MRNLRQYKGYALIMSLFLCLSSCNKDELNSEISDNKLRIKVLDSGYFSAEPLDSRTATDGFKTTFTGGDLIGVFTVVNNEVKQSNVGMMYSEDVDGWVGLLKKEEDTGAKYFAYYPWKEDLQGTVNPEATDAEAFFKDIVDKWELPKDQSSYRKYTMSDLMVGKGVPSGGGDVVFSLSHQMSLVLIHMPVVKYQFSNTEPKLKDYIVPAEGTFFNEVKPALLHDGNYRFLIKPNKETTVSAGYKKEGKVHEFSKQVTLAPGYYKKYLVDEGTSEVKNHNLQAGDYYMKDGNLIAKGTNLTEQQKKDCIGIVFWVGDATVTDPILKVEHPNCIHGLVCSLREGDNTPWQPKFNVYRQTVQNWVAENSNGYRNLVSTSRPDDNMNQILGYNNTKAMELFNDDPYNYNQWKLEIIDKLKTFRMQHQVPDFTSGWFLPSIKELYIMFNKDVPDIVSEFFPSEQNRKLLTAIFESMGRNYADLFNSKKEDKKDNYYYSSTEHNVFKVWTIRTDEWYYTVAECNKDYTFYHTRFILSF